MKKKLISLLLVLTMVLTLVPAAVFAEDGFDPVADAPQGNRKVAVMVYGELISDLAWKSGMTILNMSDQLKAQAQSLLANAKLPEMEMVLVSPEGYEYPLTKNGVPGASFVGSFNIETGGVLGWLDDILGWLQDLWSWLVEDVDTIGNFYEIYGATNVPDGTYTLKVHLINVDLEGQQISINQEQAYKLLETCWMLVEASAKQPIQDFMSDETDIRLPAILKATADQNGVVRFTEDSNCTLTWSIEILFKTAGILSEELQDVELDPNTFENENLQALTEMMLIAVKYAMANGAQFFDEHGDIITTVVNDWVYPLMQNDNVMEYGKNAVKATVQIFANVLFKKWRP